MTSFSFCFFFILIFSYHNLQHFLELSHLVQDHFGHQLSPWATSIAQKATGSVPLKRLVIILFQIGAALLYLKLKIETLNHCYYFLPKFPTTKSGVYP